MNPDIPYLIALLKLKGVGAGTAIKLLKHFGSAKAAFEEIRTSTPESIGISTPAFESLIGGPNWLEVDREMDFIQKNDIDCISYTDTKYPRRLKFCPDSPALLFAKGKVDFNHPKILAVVGTRNPTQQGKKVAEKIVAELASQNVLIISGLALGIDIVAHRTAVENRLPTIAVLGHGLDRIYPLQHRSIGRKIQENGALLTEFFTNTSPDRENFPKRNRIVAGMADAILVVESQRTGGSMITADLGFGYARDVFAVPGRPGDRQSEGCNFLIRQNKASLVESAIDIKYLMNWKDRSSPKEIQKQLFVQLSPTEEQLFKVLSEKKKLSLDELCFTAGIPVSKASVPLLTLELNGMVRTLPGKMIELV